MEKERRGGGAVGYHPPRLEPTLPEGPSPGPAPEPARARSALAFFAVLLALWVPDAFAQASSRLFGLAWSELFALLLPALVAAAGSNLRAGRYLGLDRARPLPVALGALLGAAGFFAASGVMVVWVVVLPRSVVHLFDVARIFEGTPLVQVIVTVVAVALAPICEEAAFRGFLQRTLARALGPGAAIGITALLFAVRHVDPVRFPALVLLGAVFGWASWRSGSLWPAIAAHAANNALASGLALAGADTSTTELPTLGDAVAPLLAGGAALALVAAGFWWATPSPPPPEDAVALRDPSLVTTRFRLDRVPAPLFLASLAGLLALSTLVLLAAEAHGVAGP